ncbi:MAG: curli production assembly protein CsgG [Nitrospinae bacterium]|nr:curli production assembly protein CsgG [Nitrospinota bacterium]
MRIMYFAVIFLLSISGCATVSQELEPRESQIPRSKQQTAQKEISVPAQKTYKRKIAIIRFTNETTYGRSLLLDKDLDRIGKQTSDMLASRLIQSGRFLVFERTDLSKLLEEQQNSSVANELVGVDTVIAGSVTEFGRSVTGEAGFLSSTKVQTAKAKVDIRLIDVRTGHAFFSAIGAGKATTESGEVFGFGSRAGYDSTLNDKVIASAISDVIDKLVSNLEKRPWRTDILDIDGTQIFISGGKLQGLKVGDLLNVMKPGKSVKSRQSGFNVSLPPTKVASIKVISLFGDNETNEGSICKLIEGNIDNSMIRDFFVAEQNYE